MQLQPMGDQALLAHCPNEQAALTCVARVRHRQFPWLLDIVQAYQSVAFFVDFDQIDFAQAAALLTEIDQTTPEETANLPGTLHIIPCCYGRGLDLERVTQATGLAAEEVIRLHSSQVYTVYAIGFCPGFPYLGYLPPELSGIPRLPTPRLRVEAGSVGLTGRQTGIYTLERPGGWNIVGRTPLQLVDVADAYFPLRTGDRVQFRSIGVDEYAALAGNRIGSVAF